MKRLTTALAASALAATALGCATLLDSEEYEARPQTNGQAGLPDQDANDDYLEEQSNR
ncbi:MAG TPA: hypothetical protein VKB65_13430 [Myxococcota bacterium]|nr:hypothetical protein [Myxococcota bacterium]